MRRLLLPILLLIASTAPSVRADESSTDELMDFYSAELVTTASKREERKIRVPAAVSVLTREDIELSPARTLPDLLRQVPGVDAMVALASNSSLGIRGFADPIDQSMIVLVNGRTIYLDFIGSVFFDELPISLAEIERIEILRGPSSTIWGGNAAAGVINIITRSAEDLAGTTVSLLAAERDRYDADLIQAGVHGRLDYVISAGRSSSSTFEDPKVDAFASPHANLRLNWNEGGENSLTLSTGYVGLDGPVLSDLGPITRDGYTAHLMAEFSHGGFTVRAFDDRTNSNVDFGLVGTKADVRASTTSIDIFDHLTAGRHDLIGGVEVRRLTTKSQLAGDKQLFQNLVGVYLQDAFHITSRLDATLGLRYDRHPLTRPQLSPHLALVFEPVNGHILRASYAEAFRNPSLTEFYIDTTVEIPFPIELQPNPDLEPELTRTAEIGYRYSLEDRLFLDLTLFQNRLEDFVVFNETGHIPGTTIPNAFQFQNLSESRSGSGAELEVRAKLPGSIGLFGAYTWQHISLGQQTTDERWPANKLALGLTWRGAVEAEILGTYTSGMELEEGELPSHAEVRARLAIPLFDGRLRILLDGENLLDRQHKEFPAGETLGRRMGIGLRIRLPG